MIDDSQKTNEIESDADNCSTVVLGRYISKRMNTESGFMGLTHALSALAIVLAALAFIPDLLNRLFGDSSPAMTGLICLVIIGGALLPDLDNTNSSAESALGFLGTGISETMRFTAPLIQGIMHTKYDKDWDNPHRGFYHTGLCSILVGMLFAFLCSPVISFHIGDFVFSGEIIALVLAFIGTEVGIATLGKKVWGKSKTVRNLIPVLVSVGVVLFLWKFLSVESNYSLIGVAFGIGWFIHILGDMFTTYGVPILAPIPIHGKMWYRVRILKIQAGGTIENIVFIPLFLIIVCLSIYHMIS